MSVLALAWIRGPAPESDGTYKLNLDIWAGTHFAQIANDEFFAPGTLSATVNASLKAFVKAYCETEWAIEFGLLDSVKLVNPVSLL